MNEHHQKEVRRHWENLVRKYAAKDFRLDTSQEVANVINDAINLACGIEAQLSAIAPLHPHVDGQNFYELCQEYRHSKEIAPYPGLPNTVQAFNNLREYIKTGKLPWPSYEVNAGGVHPEKGQAVTGADVLPAGSLPAPSPKERQ